MNTDSSDQRTRQLGRPDTAGNPTSQHIPTPGASAPGRDAATRLLPGGERALVLGGGGSTGNAWLLGVVAGLFDGGVDVTRPDLTIGTSAGATAAAQLAAATPAELYAAAATRPPAGAARPPAAVPNRRPADQGVPGPRAGRGQLPPVPAAAGNSRVAEASSMMELTSRLIAEFSDPADYRRRLGATAIDLLEDNSSWPDRWRATVAARLPWPDWPGHRVLLTTVDAISGEPVCLDNLSGVELVDAVAASCASGLPYPIDGVPHLDGGYRRNENADLAAGHRRVLVLSPFGGRSRTPADWGQQLAAQVEELRAAGSRVETIIPDRDLTGATAMDLSLRPAAAELGHRQGLALVARIGEFWN